VITALSVVAAVAATVLWVSQIVVLVVVRGVDPQGGRSRGRGDNETFNDCEQKNNKYLGYHNFAKERKQNGRFYSAPQS